MQHGTGITLAIVIILIIAGYFGYQYYVEQRLRSERISSLMKYANTTDYDKASLFDEKYGYLASHGKYNQSVLDFFSHWLLNNSLDYDQYLREQRRFERIHSLMKHANTTDYNAALLFDDRYSYMANVNSYNQSVLEFFSYWLLDQSLAETCLEILETIEEANSYLSKLNSYATSYFKDNLTLVLSVFTDRDEYLLSVGAVNFTVIVLSNKDLGYVNITIFGFKSRYRGYVVNNKWIYPTGVLNILVARGFNSKSFNIDIPCSPCYGVESGLNNLTCVIKYGGLNLNATKAFLLK
ncbi:MAG: hypothetical protein QW797_02300 [Thermoproteota archaeon]